MVDVAIFRDRCRHAGRFVSPPSIRGGFSIFSLGDTLRGTVAKKLGCSNVTVSTIRSRFVSEAEDVGILAAASEYGIEEQVGKLMDIGAVVEVTKVDASKAPLGLKIVQAVESFGVDTEGVPGFIEACYTEATKQGMLPEAFVKTVKGLQGWNIRGQEDYQQLLEDVESMHKEFEELEDKTYAFEQKRDAAKQEMHDAVKDKQTTLMELNQFTALRDKLAPLGLDMGDAEKAGNCILEVSKRGNDAVAVVQYYSQGIDLSKRSKDQEARLGNINKEILKRENTLKRLEGELAEKVDLVARVREAKALGVRPSQLIAVVEAAREVGARRGLGHDESIAKLESDLRDAWEAKLGFENERTSQEEKLRIVNERIKRAEERERVALDNARAQEQALAGLNELRKHVSPTEIVDFKRMIVDSGQDVSTFRTEIQRLGSLSAVVDGILAGKDVEVAKLRGEETTLNAQVQELRRQKEAAEGEMMALKSQAVINIIQAEQTIRATAENLRKAFEDEETGYASTIKRLGESARGDMKVEYDTMRTALKKSLEPAERMINKFVSDAEAIGNNTWEAGRLIGFNTHLVSLFYILEGKQVESTQALTTIKMGVDAFIDYLTRTGDLVKCPSGFKFREELQRLLT
jgi:hypothetical protein